MLLVPGPRQESLGNPRPCAVDPTWGTLVAHSCPAGSLREPRTQLARQESLVKPAIQSEGLLSRTHAAPAALGRGALRARQESLDAKTIPRDDGANRIPRSSSCCAPACDVNLGRVVQRYPLRGLRQREPPRSGSHNHLTVAPTLVSVGLAHDPCCPGLSRVVRVSRLCTYVGTGRFYRFCLQVGTTCRVIHRPADR
jgi:hypothetical protein